MHNLKVCLTCFDETEFKENIKKAKNYKAFAMKHMQHEKELEEDDNISDTCSLAGSFTSFFDEEYYATGVTNAWFFEAPKALVVNDEEISVSEVNEPDEINSIQTRLTNYSYHWRRRRTSYCPCRITILLGNR
jgi:hypothetical protein